MRHYLVAGAQDAHDRPLVHSDVSHADAGQQCELATRGGHPLALAHDHGAGRDVTAGFTHVLAGFDGVGEDLDFGLFARVGGGGADGGVFDHDDGVGAGRERGTCCDSRDLLGLKRGCGLGVRGLHCKGYREGALGVGAVGAGDSVAVDYAGAEGGDGLGSVDVGREDVVDEGAVD